MQSIKHSSTSSIYNIRLDPITVATINEINKVLASDLEVTRSISLIVRRSLRLYADYLTSLLSDEKRRKEEKDELKRARGGY